jgi:hypothetical protein
MNFTLFAGIKQAVPTRPTRLLTPIKLSLELVYGMGDLSELLHLLEVKGESSSDELNDVFLLLFKLCDFARRRSPP